MSNFLLGLGRALRAGGSLAGQWRQEDLAQERENRAAEMQNLQMALMQRDQDLQEQQFDLTRQTFEGQQQDRARGFAREMLQDAGPNGNLDPAAVEAITAGGFGHRVRPAVTQDPVTFSPVEGGSASVIPTAGEQIKLNEQQVVERARRALEDPRFASLPPERREIIRQQAGLSGQAPATWDEQ